MLPSQETACGWFGEYEKAPGTVLQSWGIPDGSAEAGKRQTFCLDKSLQTCIMKVSKRDDKASSLKPAHSERGLVQAPQSTRRASHFGAARDERDDSSPLQDVMRCLSL